MEDLARKEGLLHFPPLSDACAVMEGMFQSLAEQTLEQGFGGHELFQPEHTRPITRMQVLGMIRVAEEGMIDFGSEIVRSSMIVVTHMLPTFGNRKGQITVDAKEGFGPRSMSCAHFVWLIDGRLVLNPTVEDLESLAHSQHALMGWNPNADKCDALGNFWGPRTQWVKHSATAEINAPRAIAQHLMRYPTSKPRNTALLRQAV